MKKLIAIILLSVMAITLCAACGEPVTEVSREPVDVRYTEAYDAMETDYEYVFDWWKGDFVLVPVMHTVRHEAKWEIQYRIVRSDGSEKTEWVACTEEEYNSTKDKLAAGEEEEGWMKK